MFGALSVEELHHWPLLQLARGPIKLGSLAVFVDHSLIRRCRWYRVLLVLIRGLRDGLDNKGRWFLGICKLLRLGADTQDLYNIFYDIQLLRPFIVDNGRVLSCLLG